MLNDTDARSKLAVVVEPIAKALLAIKMTPNMVTALGCLGVVISAALLIPNGHFVWAIILVGLFMLTDMLDGTMARLSGISGPWGAMLDSTMDRIADTVFFLSILIYFVRNEQWGLVWATGIVLVGSVVISYSKARAESVGLATATGFAERTERLLIAGLGLVLLAFKAHTLAAIVFWALAALVVVTACQRLRASYLDAMSKGTEHAAAQTSNVAAENGVSGEGETAE